MIGKPLSDLTFEEWVIFTFDNPVNDSRLEWYWDVDANWWDGPAALTVDYLTRTFENTWKRSFKVFFSATESFRSKCGDMR